MAVVFFDFDSTVVKKETLDDAIASALSGHPEKDRIIKNVEEITRLGMEGKIGFLESVTRRLQVVSLSKRLLERRGEAMLQEITDGMEELFAWLRENNYSAHIVSGGFTEYISPVATFLGISKEHTHTNRFIFDENGEVVGTDPTALLWTNEGKAPALRALRSHYPNETFVMIGDGMNDYKAFESGAANIFYGFGANVVRESVQTKAPHFFFSTTDLLSHMQKELQ